MPMVLVFYRIITTLLGPLVYRLFQRLRVTRGKESPERLQERFGITENARPDGVLLWLHAASNGETLAALGVVELLEARFPRISFLITTGTLTSSILVEKKKKPNLVHQFLPYDVPHWINRFLDHWRPDLFIGIESELWPNLILLTAERHIPLLLLNGCMSEKTFSSWQRSPGSAKKILEKFSLILTQSSAQTTLFQKLGAAQAQTLGNIKFASPPLEFSSQLLTTLQAQIGDRPCWLAASTHEGEEEYILAASQILLDKFPDLLTIIAPRHPQRAPRLLSLLQGSTLHYAQRSAGELPGAETQIYLADTSGEMGIFYRLCPIVFLGGSLVKTGGHNLIEPAQLDCTILHGPHMFNQNEMHLLFKQDNATLEIKSSQELADQIKLLLNNPDLSRGYQARAYKAAQNQQKIMVHITGFLEPYIQQILK